MTWIRAIIETCIMFLVAGAIFGYVCLAAHILVEWSKAIGIIMFVIFGIAIFGFIVIGIKFS